MVDDGVIYARLVDDEFVPHSEAVVLAISDDELAVPTHEIAASRCPGFAYRCLEVFIAKEAAQVWSQWHVGKQPDAEQIAEAVCYKANNDAWGPSKLSHWQLSGGQITPPGNAANRAGGKLLSGREFCRSRPAAPMALTLRSFPRRRIHLPFGITKLLRTAVLAHESVMRASHNVMPNMRTRYATATDSGYAAARFRYAAARFVMPRSISLCRSAHFKVMPPAAFVMLVRFAILLCHRAVSLCHHPPSPLCRPTSFVMQTPGFIGNTHRFCPAPRTTRPPLVSSRAMKGCTFFFLSARLCGPMLKSLCLNAYHLCPTHNASASFASAIPDTTADCTGGGVRRKRPMRRPLPRQQTLFNHRSHKSSKSLPRTRSPPFRTPSLPPLPPPPRPSPALRRFCFSAD